MKLPYKPDFSNKVAVVTGGSGVLCSVLAEAIAGCGAKVAILNRSAEKAQPVVDAIQSAGGAAMAVPVDVLREEDVEAAHQRVLEAFGPCDILINGVGGNNACATCDDEFFDRAVLEATDRKSFFDLDPAGFDAVFGLNLKGTLLPTRAFARDMLTRTPSDGVILNISSMNAFSPLTKIPAYSAAKAAVSNFTKWLAVYFAKTGVRVNAIAPGFFSAQQNAALLWKPDGSPTARTEKILRNTPMGRFGEPEELVGSALFLLDGNASAFVTGVVLPVDGGFSAYSGV